MFCRRSPGTYLIWLIDEYPWRAGTRVILSLEHAHIIGRRIGDRHLVGCGLDEGVTEFDDQAFCAWELDWPFTGGLTSSRETRTR
jgi:hypothetical protein